MNFKELCEARYSCRNYNQEKAIEPEKLNYIQECVRLAPSAVNRQPWKFILVTDSERLQVIHACYRREWIRTAPAAIICCAHPESAWTRRYDGKNHADIDVSTLLVVKERHNLLLNIKFRGQFSFIFYTVGF